MRRKATKTEDTQEIQNKKNSLNFDVVISDTNVWLELQQQIAAAPQPPRLMFEHQLQMLSKAITAQGGKFLMMGETYEEIDRFAAMQDPQDHKEADWTDNIVCLNTAARLAKRAILLQQRENRIRIEGIGAESHHASFADPAIIKRVVELFAEGKRVLLLTNDTSVAIRSVGLCDDLQRYNNVSDKDWNEKYVPLRPVVYTFDDLKNESQFRSLFSEGSNSFKGVKGILKLNANAFRPGDKHRGDNLNIEQKKQESRKVENKKVEPEPKKVESKKVVQKKVEPKKVAAKPAPKPKAEPKPRRRPVKKSAATKPAEATKTE